ncbi:hypothetical protein ECOPMV1_pHUSEC411like00020 (plasmid) [Escherichia coli PMV-1]|nr:hypothetical protein ECOPMV1_pHUSEC411like00020 [Escherichia coli PMV-1]
MCPFRGAKAPPAVHFTGFSPQWTFPMGARLPPHGAASGGGPKFCRVHAKNFVAGASHPGQRNGRGLRLPPESPQRGNRPQGGGRREDCCAIRRSFLTHRQVCRERRSRRDRGGATGTVAASPGFHASDRSGSPKPRQRVRRRLAGAPAAARRSRA